MRPLSILVAAVLAAAACGGGRTEPCAAPAPRSAVARPSSCRPVAPGELARALAAAAPGTTLCLAAGAHDGPFAIPAGVSVWGPPEARLRAPRSAVVVDLVGAGARLLGVTVDAGTGGHSEDAAVRVRADDAAVVGVTVEASVHGILVERARRVHIVGNRVRGSAAPAMGLRGDTIRLWETRDSTVADNRVEDGRDLVVWYSSNNRIANNRVTRGRYGTHLMYSHDNRVERNRYDATSVGVFVMYSRRVVLRGNVTTATGGAAGMAFGFKDSGDVTVADNVVVRAATGLYLDNSPVDAADRVEVTGNGFVQCGGAVVFHGGAHRTTFRGNDIVDAATPLRQDGGGEVVGVIWDGNYFDDYAGYDLDGDGTGDIPYQERSTEEELTSRHPQLAFFRGTAALGAAGAAATLVPLFEPRTLLVDRRPRMRGRDLEGLARAD